MNKIIVLRIERQMVVDMKNNKKVKETEKIIKDCQNCKHLYECDNTENYKKCIEENQIDYEEVEKYYN